MGQAQIAEESLAEYQPPPRPRGVKNPFRSLNGCMVPLCLAQECTYQRKKICALRRYFLIIQKERRKYLRDNKRYFEEEAITIYKQLIYFWRKKKKKKKKNKRRLK